jgi:hypothetical protein
MLEGKTLGLGTRGYSAGEVWGQEDKLPSIRERRPLEGRMPRRILRPLQGILLALTLAFALVLGGTKPSSADFWGHKLPNTPTDFIFGYGSLINSNSRNATSSAPIPAIPARISGAFGYRRCWNDRSQSGFTALGLCRTQSGELGATVNGVLYPVQHDDLAKFDKREEGYNRVAVPLDQIEAAGWQRLPEEGRIWIYVPAHMGKEPDASYPILQSYIDVVVEGGLEYGEDFAQEILETTYGWNHYWLNDRQLPRRPWVYDAKAAKVDELIKKTAPAAGYFNERLFAEVYAARWFAPAQGSDRLGQAARQP